MGRLFNFLRQQRLADSTLVIITGDHGEAFGFPHRFMFHGTCLYQEAVNVPCILWNPTLFNQPRQSDVVGGHVDLPATILDVLNLPTPASWQGHSLFDPSRPPRAYFTCNNGSLLRGMRQGDDKFIYNVTLAREELYNLASDPTEQHNLATSQPDRCRQYRQRLSAVAAFERHHLAGLTAGKDKAAYP